MLDQLREIIVDSWYMNNLVKIGPHTKEVGDAIKQEKLDEMKKVDPVLKNTKEIWTVFYPEFLLLLPAKIAILPIRCRTYDINSTRV